MYNTSLTKPFNDLP